MAYDGWMQYNGVEFINVSRAAQLAPTLGIHVLRVRESIQAVIQTIHAGNVFGLGGFGLGPFGGPAESNFYQNITGAPWYDSAHPASGEFAGFVPLAVQGLDDSTLESTPIEYITDGGHPGKPRNATASLVFNGVLIASTDRGAEYGKRWLSQVLRGPGRSEFALGADLDYFRNITDDVTESVDKVHRRDVRMTRGLSITRKRRNSCAAMWWVTFTMTAADPFEYGEAVPKVTAIGGPTPATGPGVTSAGSLVGVQADCPVYDYSPLYDPLYPALVAAPAPPDFLPAGWDIANGQSFDRRWARISPVEPSDLMLVPFIKLTTTTEARMVRVSIWSSTSPNNDQCDPLFSVVVSYLPANLPFYIDAKQQAAYTWDGVSPSVRRTDSLIYSPDANPMRWDPIISGDGLLVTLDVFAKTVAQGGGYQGSGNVRAAVDLIPRSD